MNITRTLWMDDLIGPPIDINIIVLTNPNSNQFGLLVLDVDECQENVTPYIGCLVNLFGKVVVFKNDDKFNLVSFLIGQSLM